MRRTIQITICLGILSIASLAGADPVQSSISGHWYEYVDDLKEWPEARDAAVAATWKGLTGHLATFTSQEEFDFALTLGFDTSWGQCWLGGYQDPVMSPADQNWCWVTGESWGFTSWGLGEPNDHSGYGSEPYLSLSGIPLPPHWNDAGPTGTGRRLVEYDSSSPVYWEENGHWYQFFSDLKTWPEARLAAANKGWLGMPCHLATITSQAEFDFISANIPDLELFGSFFIGGYQDPAMSPVDQNWYWVSGEPWDYTNWCPGEPNDHMGYGSEPYLAFYSISVPQGFIDVGTVGQNYYLVEYGDEDVKISDTGMTWSALKKLYLGR